jgi:hypothetical protein
MVGTGARTAIRAGLGNKEGKEQIRYGLRAGKRKKLTQEIRNEQG